MHDKALHLSQALKQRRSSLGLSLDRAAERTGVSKAMLGQIERGESSPTIATLWKIATGLEVALSALLEEAPSVGNPIRTEVRKPERLRQQPGGEGMLVASLYPYEPRFGFEYFELSLVPGYERISEPHEAGVVELITVLEGSLEVLANGRWRKLEKGESIRFAGDLEHGYRNRAKEKTVFHCLIHYLAKEGES